MSYTQRMYAFAICLGVGMILSFLSSLSVFGLVTGHGTQFIVLYSLGNVVSLAATAFLLGPWRQLQRMFDASRWIASSVYLTTLALTLVVAIIVHPFQGKGAVIMMLLLVQWCSLVWYCASYIPGARGTIRGCIQNALE